MPLLQIQESSVKRERALEVVEIVFEMCSSDMLGALS